MSVDSWPIRYCQAVSAAERCFDRRIHWRVPIDIFGPIFAAFCTSTFEFVRDTIQQRRRQREQQPESPVAVTAPPTTWLPPVVEPARDTRPVVLVARPPERSGYGVALIDQVAATLCEVEGIDSAAEVLTTSHVIDGRQAALMQVREQYATSRVVLVYFEPAPRGLAAYAVLARMFDTLDGDDTFTFRVARYDAGASFSTVVPRSTGLPSWQTLGTQGMDRATCEALIARTVMGFVLGALDAYWQVRGVEPVLLRRLMTPTTAAAEATGQQRLDQEAQALLAAGYGLSLQRHDAHTQIVVSNDRGTIGLVVALDFPASPPRVLRMRPTVTEVAVDRDSWSPQRRLVEIAEALL